MKKSNTSIEIATDIDLDGFAPAEDRPNDYRIAAVNKYYSVNDQYQVSWSPVIESNRTLTADIQHIVNISDADDCLVYYKPTRVPSSHLHDDLKDDFHAVHPKKAKRTPLNPDAVTCPECAEWCQSNLSLVAHYATSHPSGQTIEGIRRRMVEGPVAFWNPDHPMLQWFRGRLRTSIRAKMKFTTKHELGSVVHLHAPRSVMVACLIDPRDDTLQIEYDPVSGQRLYVEKEMYRAI
jgi:hypothetical protein